MKNGNKHWLLSHVNALFNIVLFCRLAIIQLSTWNEVFILDMITLTDNVKDSEMKHFAESFFANPQVLKLGKQLIFVFLYRDILNLL